ncbi:hypothetical protein DUI87_16502 [Hirundo rustica rustica]|uniref:Uncharacterized protein n=1 Tax=Hirundo rustica rustica TaxID=333673 RepID=A0A3M0K174_HIRRU|nr:hypothetical protein DUI87_16502 [Hirundo rustica rustica]
MKSSKDKFRVLHLERNYPIHQYGLGADVLEYSSVEKDLEAQSALLLVEPAKGKVSAMSLSLDRDPGFPELGSGGQAGEIPRPGAAGAIEHL